MALQYYQATTTAGLTTTVLSVGEAMSKIIKCPECLHEFDSIDSVTNDKKMMAQLVKSGFGYREIGNKFNQHPQTVKYWAEKLNTDDVSEAEI